MTATRSVTASRLRRHKLPTCSCLHGQGGHTGAGGAGNCRHCSCDSFQEIDRSTIALAPPIVKKITDEEIREAVRLRLTVAEMCQKFNCSDKAVERAKQRAGLPRKENAPRITGEEMARARLLKDEGMPLTWVAEDLNRRASGLQRKLRPGPDPDWKAVWQQILKDPELLALHHLFCPKKIKIAA